MRRIKKNRKDEDSELNALRSNSPPFKVDSMFTS